MAEKIENSSGKRRRPTVVRELRDEPRARTSELPQPLSAQEAESLRQNLRRLAAELRGAMRGLPDATQGASALARELRIDRATAHRVLILSGQRDPSLDVLAESPGADALDQFAAAVARRNPKGADVESLRATLIQFRRALGELGGGSKSRLLRRIAASGSSSSQLRARREQELREQLFGIVAELVGRSTETRIDMMICRPSPDDARQMDYAQVRGVLGHRARAHAQPMSVELIGHVTPAEPGSPHAPLKLNGEPIEDSSFAGTLLESFSTRPLPFVVSRGLGDRVRNVVDPTYSSTGNPVDVVMGFQRPHACQHPQFDPVPTLEVGALIREPTRWLILDTWLHRDMTDRAVPSLETYLWSPTLTTSLSDHWLDRLPVSPLLSVMGRGLDRVASIAWSRHEALTRDAFEQLGWDPNDYVGYRAQIAYPMWGAAYFAVFDYSR